MDENKLYELIQKVIKESHGTYGIKLYGRFNEESYRIELVGYLRKNGWFEITTPVNLTKQDITPFLFDSIMQQVRKVATIRDREGKE